MGTQHKYISPSKQDEDFGTFSSKQLKITNIGQSQQLVNGITQASKAGRGGEEGQGRRKKEKIKCKLRRDIKSKILENNISK